MDYIKAHFGITLAGFIIAFLLFMILLELRRQEREETQFKKTLLAVLSTLSQDQLRALQEQTKHNGTIGAVLLRAIRRLGAAQSADNILTESTRRDTQADPVMVLPAPPALDDDDITPIRVRPDGDFPIYSRGPEGTLVSAAPHEPEDPLDES